MIDKPPNNGKYKNIMTVQNSGTRGLSILALIWMLLGFAGSGAAGQVQEANAGKGGQPMEIKALLAPGQVTVIDFYSPFCPPCMRLAPLMEQLAQKRADLALKKININRPEVQGIDWRSPLAQQYRIHSVPYFMIFNPQGKLAAQGEAALRQIIRWLKEAKILQE
jgi:thiol-disulfide isomerase/thioredoxin